MFNCIKIDVNKDVFKADLIIDSNLGSLRQNDIDLLFGPSSQDLLSEILFVIRTQISIDSVLSYI